MKDSEFEMGSSLIPSLRGRLTIMLATALRDIFVSARISYIRCDNLDLRHEGSAVERLVRYSKRSSD